MTARSRYSARRDLNEPAIVRALEQLGASVVRLDVPCDLLVGYKGRTTLIEVKNEEGYNRYTDAQVAFLSKWNGSPVATVRTVLDALTAVTTKDEALRVVRELAT